MQEKIYNARFFNQDSGVEITLDEAQSISKTGCPIKILFNFIHSELTENFDKKPKADIILDNPNMKELYERVLEYIKL